MKKKAETAIDANNSSRLLFLLGQGLNKIHEGDWVEPEIRALAYDLIELIESTAEETHIDRVFKSSLSECYWFVDESDRFVGPFSTLDNALAAREDYIRWLK